MYALNSFRQFHYQRSGVFEDTIEHDLYCITYDFWITVDGTTDLIFSVLLFSHISWRSFHREKHLSTDFSKLGESVKKKVM